MATDKSNEELSMSGRAAKDVDRHEEALKGVGIEPEDQKTVFSYVMRVFPAKGDTEVDPGPDTAAVTAALNAGFRPIGEATLSGPEDEENSRAKVFKWSVPVLSVRGPGKAPEASVVGAEPHMAEYVDQAEFASEKPAEDESAAKPRIKRSAPKKAAE